MKKINILKTILFVLFLVLASLGGYFYYDRVYKNRNIDKYNSLVNEASTLYGMKNYSKSLQKYTDATEKYEKGYEAYSSIIRILLDKNLDDKAIEVSKSAEDRVEDQHMVSIYISIADYYYQNQDWQRAKQYYEKALESGYSDYANLGIIKSIIKSGSTNIDSKYWQSPSDISMKILFEKNLLYALVKSLDNDLTEIDLVIEKLDNQSGEVEELAKNSSTLNVIEDSERLLILYRDLKASFDQAVEKKDDKLYYRALFAKEALNQGYPVIAVELLEGSKTEEYWEGLYYLGRGYYGVNKYDRSIENLEKAISAGSDKPEVYLYIARAYYLKKDTNKSTEYYNRAITFANDEEKIEIYHEFIEILFELELYNQALVALESLGQIESDDWLNLAYLKIYYTTKDFEGMEKYLGAVSEEGLVFKNSYTPYDFEPELGSYYFYYIKYLLDNKDVAGRDSALDQFLEKYAQKDQTDPYYNYLHAVYLLEQGDLEQAEKFASQAIEYDLEGEISVKAKKLLASV